MVASTDIKWFTSSNLNAPQLSNAWGVMIDVLDACLITGINIGTVSTLTASDTTVTATFGTAHSVSQYQVIQISGASPSEYNGDFRVLAVPDSTSLTFELAATPSASTATGTISAKLAPMGWEKSFSGTQKAAYRSLNTLLPSRPYLRVDNSLDPVYTTTYAKYAKVGIVETMTDIDTMSGVQAPYDAALPDKNWVGTGSGETVINGWARWYYAIATETTNGNYNLDTQAPETGSRQWLIVGNEDYFYFVPEFRPTPTYTAGLIYGFGSFETSIPIDNANIFLSSTLSYVKANDTTYKRLRTALNGSTNQSCLIQRNYTNATSYATALTKSFLDSISTGINNTVVNNSNSGITSFDVFLLESGNVMRGRLSNIKWIYCLRPYNNLQLIAFGDDIYLAKNVAADSSSTVIGQVLFKIGALS